MEWPKPSGEDLGLRQKLQVSMEVELAIVVMASGLLVNALEDLLTRKLELKFPKPFVSVIVSRTNCLFEGPPPVPELQWECCIARTSPSLLHFEPYPQ
jgi:hypothetical protein